MSSPRVTELEADYIFRLLTLSAEELAETSELLRLVFPRARHLTPRYLQWKYVENPDGRAVGCNAYLGDMLVGHMAATPMRATVEGESRRGMFMLNGAVHPLHRRRGLQSRISAAIFEEAVDQGYSFCVGTGNKYSTLPLLTRFRMVRPLEAMIGLGLPRRREGRFTPSFERLWSSEALRWRLSNPERTYAVRPGDGNVAVIAPSGIPGIGALLYHGPNGWNLQAREATSPGPFRVWLGLDPAIDWRRSSFLPIPARLRPSPLNLVFKDLSGGSLHPDDSRFIFRAIDFDPY